jgi:hypothetical protein
MRSFKLFDVIVIIIGTIGTLHAFGALANVSHMIVVLLGLFSSMTCGFSAVFLALNRYIRRVDLQQERVYLYHILANAIPMICFVAHLTETPWERFYAP